MDSYSGHGKFTSARDEVLHRVTLDAADNTTGHTEAPVGHVSLIVFESVADFDRWSTEDDRATLAQYGAPHSVMVGGFIVREDNDGFVTVETYPSGVEARDRFDALEAEHIEWHASIDKDVSAATGEPYVIDYRDAVAYRESLQADTEREDEYVPFPGESVVEYHRYRVTMRHDAGTIAIETVARDADVARAIVCKAECAPLRSAIKVERVDG